MLFKVGLQPTIDTYDNQHQQWEVVAFRLAEDQRKYRAWWWVAGALILLMSSMAAISFSQARMYGAQNTKQHSTSLAQLEQGKNRFTIDSSQQTNIEEEGGVSPLEVNIEDKALQLIPQKKEAPNPDTKLAAVISSMTIIPSCKDEPQATGQSASPLLSVITKPLPHNINLLTIEKRGLASDIQLPDALPITKWQVHLAIGTQREFLQGGKVIDQPSWGYFGELQLRRGGKWQLGLHYGQQMVDRQSFVSPAAYGVSVDSLPASIVADTTSLRYTERQLQLSAIRNICRLGRTTIGLGLGTQFVRQAPANLTYQYFGTYVPETIEMTLPASNWYWAHGMAIAQLSQAIGDYWQLQARYQYVSPLQSVTPDWGQRHHLQIGITRHLH